MRLVSLVTAAAWRYLTGKSRHDGRAAKGLAKPPLLHLGSSIDPRLQEIFSSWPHTTPDAADCDLVLHGEILWANPGTPAILAELSSGHAQARSKVIVVIVDDFEHRYRYFPNLILLRTSLRASKVRRNDFVLPYVWETLGSPYEPVADSGAAKVGFCGLVHAQRKELIKVFENSSAVRTDFIKRDAFWGGSPHDPGLVADFNRNLRENQFVLCNRGSGNFSMRFYQTLAAGRIPVLVDTDTLLPFDRQIDWKQAVVMEKSEQACLRRTIAIANAGKAAEMQAGCANLFQRYFDRSVVGRYLIEAIAGS